MVRRRSISTCAEVPCYKFSPLRSVGRNALSSTGTNDTLSRGGGVHIVHRFAREKEKSKPQQTSRCPCSSVFVACPSTGAAGSHNQNTSTRSFPIDTPTCAPYFGDTTISRPSYVCILLIRLPTNTFVCHGSILNLSRLPRASGSCPCAAFCTRRVWGRKWRRGGGRRPD